MPERVSVVVPVYNGAMHLAETLRAVLAQTLVPHEVIVADDGSTDETAAIAESLAGVTVLRLPNGGVANARNAGAAATTGDYLAFVDHDDLWRPEKLAVQARALGTTGRPFASCHLRYFFEGAIPRWFRGPSDGSPVPGFVPSCWLVSRAAFESLGGFDPRHGHGCDTDWLARAAEVGVEPLVVPECLVDYRVHQSNASQDASVFRESITGVLRAKVQRMREARQ